MKPTPPSEEIQLQMTLMLNTSLCPMPSYLLEKIPTCNQMQSAVKIEHSYLTLVHHGGV